MTYHPETNSWSFLRPIFFPAIYCHTRKIAKSFGISLSDDTKTRLIELGITWYQTGTFYDGCHISVSPEHEMLIRLAFPDCTHA